MEFPPTSYKFVRLSFIIVINTGGFPMGGPLDSGLNPLIYYNFSIN